MIFISPRRRRPGDPRPPRFNTVLLYSAAFALGGVAILGTALYLGGHPIF
jgi:hypothetical protein